MSYPRVPIQETPDSPRRFGSAINYLLDRLEKPLNPVDNITTTATTGTLPTPDGTMTIANAASPTNAELLEYCAELELRVEVILIRLREAGIIAP